MKNYISEQELIDKEIEDFNNSTYEEARIIFKLNKGYTSDLYERLYKEGYRTTISGSILIFSDNEGREICTGTGRLSLLENVATAMR